MKTQRDTPKWLADKFASDCINEHTINLKKVSILEPSAGTGILLDGIMKNMLSNLDITCVELNAEKCEVLKSKGYNTIHGDFLKTNFDKKFDIILAAPPFIKNVDVTHIEKMYSLLERWGTLITLTTPYWTINNEPHQVAFREFLKDKNHSIEMLPDNTFMEKGKTIPTAILTMHKD
jgi:phospholipid N-methyltransferase